MGSAIVHLYWYPQGAGSLGIQVPQVPTCKTGPSLTPGPSGFHPPNPSSTRKYILETELDVAALRAKYHLDDTTVPRNRAMRLLNWYLNRLPPNPVVKVSWNIPQETRRGPCEPAHYMFHV